MSPWRQSVTCLRAVPRDGGEAEAREERLQTPAMSGPVNSTNSKPSVPIGLASEMMPASGVRSGGMSMDGLSGAGA